MIKYAKIQPHLRSFIVITVAVIAMSGILLDSLLQASQIALLIGAFITLACTILFWQNSKLRYASFIIFCLLLGAWRYAISSPIGDPRSINAFIGAGKAEIQGTVTEDPKLLLNSRLLLVAVN